MGLTDVLARGAARHAHVLVVEVPGYWLTRVAVERRILGRGWRLAGSPADADILAVCGAPGAELAGAVTRLWDQMPGPRSRVEVDSPHLVEAALGKAERALVDPVRQQADSRSRPAGPVGEPNQAADPGPTHRGHESTSRRDTDQQVEASGMNHERGGHRGMDQGGHHTHDGHGGMDPGRYAGHGGRDLAPAGIALAHGGEDRDGLALDVLHVRLGPVLPHWPAGLILRCSLQGDVIVDAEAGVVDAAGHPSGRDARQGDARYRAARRCDNAASLLALAGWEDPASRARRIRDALLLHADVARAAGDLDRLRRSVGRSWVLRWSLRRLRYLTDDDLVRHGLPGHLRGDTRDRLLSMLDRAARDLSGSPAAAAAAGRPGSAPLGSIPDLVRGLDLATARLVIASLDLDPLPPGSEAGRA